MTMTTTQKKILTLAANGAMTLICSYIFFHRSSEEYTKPSFTNFIVGGAFLLLETGTIIAMRSIRDEEKSSATPATLPWANRIQRDSAILARDQMEV